MTKNFNIGLMLLLMFSFAKGFAQEKKAFALFSQAGEPLTYQRILDSISKTDVVLFGEFHNNPISHWLQFELASDLKKNNINLILGAEMFETDTQEVLDRYLSDSLAESDFRKKARVWTNYNTDYKPIVDFAKSTSTPFIATNIPRPYATKIYKNGGFSALDSLSQNEYKLMAPLPIPFDSELNSYQNMLKMMGGHGGEDLVKAQAIKDATMAHFILKNLKPNQVFFHLNGSYHSNDFEGIYWYLKTYNPDVNILTISTVEQNELNSLCEEHLNKANFIIAVDEDMTKTY
ncbi:ChaN family lipoprotein [Psychroflexus sp. CAK1W]|uniref:ChaN family lipoprotein n=1 Tax=Psychroflexus curvus TaxID=2873595 RepID=UPI001CCF0F6D|nr:ChaN family lipoprotein [Psychroflexus curvus]MBZ9626912.1 ChaN family lipoprotein [Psychroflexus curvus]